MLRATTLFISLVTASLATMASEVAFAQLPWRGNYVRRDGLFHVERARWGGGVTDNGATVLNAGITAFAPIVGFLVEREAPYEDDGMEDRESARPPWTDEYLYEQRRANDLLERTASLVTRPIGQDPPAPASQTPSGNLTPLQHPDTAPAQGGTPARTEFGPSSPWRQRTAAPVNNRASADNRETRVGAEFGDRTPWKGGGP